MAYTKFYPDGWKANEEGGTPITPESLNHMEKGIEDNDAAIQAQKTDIENLDKKDDTVLKEAKKYADDILAAAKAFSNTNLGTAKSYTDSTAAALRVSILADAKAAAASRMGGLSLAINAVDLGLDIIAD